VLKEKRILGFGGKCPRKKEKQDRGTRCILRNAPAGGAKFFTKN
jgi:hypothetical protein